MRDRYDDSILARGLLVDIFEQQERYDLAANVDDAIGLRGDFSAADYFEARQKRLLALPYGPFGTALNAAILKARTPAGLDDLDLADLTDPITPMLPLLLSVHPSLGAARLLPLSPRKILPARNGLTSPGDLRRRVSPRLAFNAAKLRMSASEMRTYVNANLRLQWVIAAKTRFP